jgi:hypothetical protein
MLIKLVTCMLIFYGVCSYIDFPSEVAYRKYEIEDELDGKRLRKNPVIGKTIGEIFLGFRRIFSFLRDTVQFQSIEDTGSVV